MSLAALAHVIRVAVGLTLVTTGIMKLFGVHLDWEGQFIPFSYSFWVGLSVAEVMVGLAMLLPFRLTIARGATYVAIMISAGFLLFHIVSLSNPSAKTCSCLGSGVNLSHVQMAVISAALLACSILGVLFPRRST